MSDAAPASTEAPAPQFPSKTFVVPASGAPPRAKEREQPSGGRTSNKAAAFIARQEAARKAEVKPEGEQPAEAPAEPAKVEAKTEEPKAEAKKPDDAAKRAEEFSAIARAEKRVRAEREAVEKERQALAAEREKAASETARAREIQELIDKGDKLAVIDKLGIDINEWARRKLGKAAPQAEPPKESPDVAALKAKVQALEEERAREKAEAAAAKATSDYEAVKQKTIAEIDSFLQNQPQYEFTRARKGSSLVFRTIEEHFTRTGRLLSLDEAAQAVESYFEEDAQQYAGVSKFVAKLAPQGAAEKTAPKQDSSGTRANPKPASSNSAAPDRVAASSTRLTREERRARAIAHLNGAAPAKR